MRNRCLRAASIWESVGECMCVILTPKRKFPFFFMHRHKSTRNSQRTTHYILSNGRTLKKRHVHVHRSYTNEYKCFVCKCNCFFFRFFFSFFYDEFFFQHWCRRRRWCCFCWSRCLSIMFDLYWLRRKRIIQWNRVCKATNSNYITTMIIIDVIERQYVDTYLERKKIAMLALVCMLWFLGIRLEMCEKPVIDLKVKSLLFFLSQ